jgi:predicted phosphate transport protein (TIGR00153 family)
LTVQFLSKLMPHERRFFDLFDQHADLVVAASAMLSELLRGFTREEHNRGERIASIVELERRADKVTHETFALLHRTFVTPLDREDIHRLISQMDDVLDLIQDTAESFQLYDIRHLTSEACELAGCLHECCLRMQKAVHLLSNMGQSAQILELCHEIDGLESQADRVMRTALSKLFREENDVRQLMKLETVYQLLESATDRCEDVANVIEGVVLENA